MHSNNDVDKLNVLFGIQLIGVISVLITVIGLPYFTKIDSWVYKIMEMIVWIVLGLVALSYFARCDVQVGLWKMIRKNDTTSSFFKGMTLTKLIFFYACMDLIVLAILVWATGGSRQSLFMPYVLVIVPLTIMLGESRTKVIFYFVLTFIIFWICLLIINENFSVNSAKLYMKLCMYDLFYGGIITLCVLFPTAVKVLIK